MDKHTDDSLEIRNIHSSLQKAIETKDCLLTSWVIVSEWMSPQGERFLKKVHSEDLPTWIEEGFLFNALMSDGWSGSADSDDEDDD